jgi:hypothetical protein
MNLWARKKKTVAAVVMILSILMVHPAFAFIIPTPAAAPPTTAVPSPQAGFNCNSLKTVKQNETNKIKIEDIEYCIGQGFAPPRAWNRKMSGYGGGGSLSMSSKCPWRHRNPKVDCLPFEAAGAASPNPSFNVNVPPRANPNLKIPPFRTPTNGRVRMPCGGSMALDIGALMNQGGQFINNVRMGGVAGTAGAINNARQIASGLLSPCNGGILGMIQGAINMVMPAGCSVNITSGVAATCSGSVLSVPTGVTMNMSSNGRLTFPDGGSFRDSLGATVSFPGNSTVSVTGASPNYTVTVTDQTGTTQTYTSNGTLDPVSGIITVNVSPGGDPTTGGTVLIPDGATLPVDSGSATIPASTP